MAEWSNAAVLKTVELARVPGVRIPLSPPHEGEMPEWSNGAVSKTVVLFRVPGVRIPFSPQKEAGLPFLLSQDNDFYLPDEKRNSLMGIFFYFCEFIKSHIVWFFPYICV